MIAGFGIYNCRSLHISPYVLTHRFTIILTKIANTALDFRGLIKHDEYQKTTPPVSDSTPTDK
jgi:hypothetical protein